MQLNVVLYYIRWHLKYVDQNWPGLAKFQPATEIDQLQLTFFVLKIESGYIFLWNMIGIHT